METRQADDTRNLPIQWQRTRWLNLRQMGSTAGAANRNSFPILHGSSEISDTFWFCQTLKLIWSPTPRGSGRSFSGQAFVCHYALCEHGLWSVCVSAGASRFVTVNCRSTRLLNELVAVPNLNAIFALFNACCPPAIALHYRWRVTLMNYISF